MGNPGEFEARLTKVEADALAARHMVAALDRDVADLGVKVDANRRAINALGVQTAERFDRVEARLDRLESKVDAGFAMMGVGMQQIVDLITPLLPPDQR